MSEGNQAKRTAIPWWASVILGILFIVGGILAYLVASVYVSEVSNLIAIVVELTAAVYISVLILMYERFEQRKTKSLLSEIRQLSEKLEGVVQKQNTMINEQYERQQKRKRYHAVRTKANLEHIRDECQTLKKLISVLLENQTDDNATRVVRHCNQQIQAMDRYYMPTIKSDYQGFVDLLNDPDFADRFGLSIDHFGAIFHDILQDSFWLKGKEDIKMQ